MALTRAEHAAAEARCEKATPGPWVHNRRAGTLGEPRIESEKEHGVVNDGWCIAETHGSDDARNATFIAHARTDLPRALVGNAALLELVERIEQRIDKLDFDICEAESIGAPYHGLERKRDELRALLPPPANDATDQAHADGRRCDRNVCFECDERERDTR